MQLAFIIFVPGQRIAPFAMSRTNTAHALRFSGSVLGCALFEVTCLVTAGGGERTLDLESEELVSRTFSSTNELSRPGKNCCAKLYSFEKASVS